MPVILKHTKRNWFIHCREEGRGRRTDRRIESRMERERSGGGVRAYRVKNGPFEILLLGSEFPNLSIHHCSVCTMYHLPLLSLNGCDSWYCVG